VREEGIQVDRKEEEREENNEKLQNKNYTISLSNNTITELEQTRNCVGRRQIFLMTRNYILQKVESMSVKKYFT